MQQTNKNMQQMQKAVTLDYAVALMLAVIFLVFFIKINTP